MYFISKLRTMEKKKRNTIVVIAIGVVLAAIITTVCVSHFKEDDSKSNISNQVTEKSEDIADIVIEDDVVGKTESEAEDGVEIIELQEPTLSEKTTLNYGNQYTDNVKPARPVEEGNPNGISQGNNYEIIDNGSDDVKEYSCGKKGHHCDSKETHNFITNLEKKGCSYCGSHSCKSFYTYDEWGNACYDPTKCERYSGKSDPSEYCQVCGKKVGTGSNNSCVRFTVDTKCPKCGKYVKSKTCHSH